MVRDLSEARDTALRSSLAAMQRAAGDAGRIAVQQGKTVRITAGELRNETPAEAAPWIPIWP